MNIYQVPTLSTLPNSFVLNVEGTAVRKKGIFKGTVSLEDFLLKV